MPLRLLFAMSRNALRIVLFVVGLLVALLPVGLGAADAGAGTKQSETADCVATVSKHSVVTKSAVSACVRSSLKVTHPCPKGSTIFVVKNETTYALRSGARPIRLPNHASLVALNKACGLSTPSHRATPTTAIEALPAPTTTTLPPTTTTLPPPPPPTAASCNPLTDAGNCYEPGEYCRDSDHGMVGVGGDGKTIACEDNDGWRWEPT
jgi:hypothetical protein